MNSVWLYIRDCHTSSPRALSCNQSIPSRRLNQSCKSFQFLKNLTSKHWWTLNFIWKIYIFQCFNSLFSTKNSFGLAILLLSVFCRVGNSIFGFFVRIPCFFLQKRVNPSFVLLKRVNRSFRSFCKERQEQRERFTIFLKEQQERFAHFCFL